MSTVTLGATDRSEALMERLLGQLIDSMELLGVYLGLRLDLYAALHDGGDATPAQLADRAGIDQRYACEWLEHQAVSGYLETTDNTDAAERRYRLPDAHADVLLDRDNPNFLAATAYMVPSVGRVLPELLDAYRTGDGIAYGDYGDDIRDHVEDFNRPMFVNELATDWLPAVPDLHERLQADPPARVADIACGAGQSSIALARAYPKIRVDGLDLDEPSIDRAHANLTDSDVADRVTFAVRDAADPQLEGTYDAAFIFEALHDMAQPVDVLRATQRLLTDDASVVIGDERVAERFTAPGDEIERLMYGFSVLHCLPAGRADTPSAATGTAMRPHTVRAYATQAGFDQFEILPIDHDVWRFYRLSTSRVDRPADRRAGRAARRPLP